MSFFQPLLLQKKGEGVYAVHGTPADAAFIALHSLLKNDPPDLVVSGINHGLNVGWDVNYSGTVGAATEASLLGFRAIAISADSHFGNSPSPNCMNAFQVAAEFLSGLLPLLMEMPWPKLEVLNINHPGIEPKGIRIAECSGLSMYTPTFEKQECKNMADETAIYLLGGSSRRSMGGDSQDVVLIQNGYATLSFLQVRQSSTMHNQNLEQVLQRLEKPHG
jgi:5'-nucleotidase